MASQIWHVGVTGLQGVAYFKVTLNSVNIIILNLISGKYLKAE